MSNNDNSILSAMDESRLQKFHWKTVLTAGMGFFTDAYDLFIIGTVTAILTPIWHLSTLDVSILNSTSLAAAALGAVTFGFLMDKFGRKAMYGVEVSLLTLGAVLSAFAPSFAWLVFFRMLVGFGVGGDYPTSSVIMSEFSNRKNRGLLVTMVFAMQGLGLLVGPVVAAGLLATGMSHAIVWRAMLGLGAIPAASVIYMRRKMSESPRYLVAVKQDENYAKEVVSELTGAQTEVTPTFEKQSLFSGRNLARLVATAGSWFLIDVAFYGNGVSSAIIMKALLPHSSMISTVLVSALIFLVAALPGYYVAAFFMDRLGRKKIQAIGFTVMALAYLILFADPGITKASLLFLLVYGVSFFFIEFGPNTTTFLVPAEVFPTNIRGLGHGLSATGGKIGATIGAFVLPGVLAAYGLANTMGLMAIVSVVGVLLTIFLLPDMAQKSLEDNEIRASKRTLTHKIS